MTKIKPRLIALLIAAVILLTGVYFLTHSKEQTPSSGNLLQNASFAEKDAEGLPENWYTDAYFLHADTRYEWTQDGAHIVNNQLNDARFAQQVSVSPNTLYCLEGKIKASAEGGWGANLSIEGVYIYPESVFDSSGEWQEVRLYGRTGEHQQSLTVYARLGGYSGESIGEAWFKDISLRAVKAAPDGYYVHNFYQESYQNTDTNEQTKEKTGAFLILACCILYAIIFLFMKNRFALPSPLLEKSNARKSLAVFSVLLLAILGRIAAALLVKGYDVDIGCFTAWAMHMASVGPVQFYNTVSFCDYPPGYMNILWLIGLLGNAIGGVTEFMVKSPAIVSDVLICLVLYLHAKDALGHRPALLLSLLWALNPVSIVTGACWGQTDSIMTLLLLIAVFQLIKGKWKIALPVYVAAVLIKPQALMFGPLGLAALILHLKNTKCDKKTLQDIFIGIGLSIAVFLALALPFIVDIQGEKKGLFFLIDLYGKTMNSYGYITINACNPYFLLGLNWLPSQDMASTPAVVITLFIALAPAIASSILHRKKELMHDLPFLCVSGLSLMVVLVLAILMLTGMLTYALLSTCIIVYTVALFGLLFFLKGSMRHLPVFAAGMLTMLFTCCGMMHERYLFPVIGLLLLGFVQTKDKRLLYLSLLVSIASFINIACVLDRNIRIGGVEAHLSAPGCGIKSDLAVLEYFSAVLITLSALFSTYVCFSPKMKEKPLMNGEAAPENVSFAPPPVRITPPPALKKRDVLLMLLGTVLYALLAFTNLGSNKAPQTAWVASPGAEMEDSFLIDLGTEREFSVLYFSGIHHYDSAFTVETDGNAQTPGELRTGTVNIGDCFRWQYVTGTQYDPLLGRYVRFSTDDRDLTLYEILIKDAQTGEIIPYTFAQPPKNETVLNLSDEQDTLEGEPGWYNSTYFDEIYHARTGFEHLHGLSTYETSHPPLGKVLISWAIALFGMTPFGWRFAGALAGVLMLPALYLLGRLLSKNKWGGLFAMLFMAFDLMHFTQTRIATIDSFVVLFILWAVYFMLYWFRMDYFAKPLWKTLVPLGLSGLFMGLSVASKWTGCYNGIGLAVIFFWGIARRWRMCRSAAAIPEKSRTEAEKMMVKKGKTLLYTIASCLIFFVAIPLIIYYISYIPYFAHSGGVTVKKVLDAAFNEHYGMLAYHSQPGLGMDHPFYSPWYEWPIIAKPMWYYSSPYNTPQSSSTLLVMGNPGVWWVGLFGLLSVVVMAVLRHVRSDLHLTKDRKLSGSLSFSFFAKEDDARYGLLILCFLAQYLPWMLVPRGTYIYHYFPSVPFIILCTGLCLDKLHEKKPKLALIAGMVLLIIALLLFIGFFPYASGICVSQKWLDAMKWFPGWIWY